MERNTATIAKSLQTGDRFYKATDRSKKVLEMVEHEVKKTIYQTYKYWCQADGDRHPQPIKWDTHVIFLRHNDNAQQPNTTTGTTNTHP